MASRRRELPPGGVVPHVTQRVSLAVVGRSDPARIEAFARERGWRHVRLVSSAHNNYNRDYLGELPSGSQMPMLNVFTKRDGEVRHHWGSELLYAPGDEGQDNRHVDFIWPLWNVLDATPEGRGTDWNPALDYG